MSVTFFSDSWNVAKIAGKYCECSVSALSKSQIIKLTLLLRGLVELFVPQNLYDIIFDRKFLLVSG